MNSLDIVPGREGMMRKAVPLLLQFVASPSQLACFILGADYSEGIVDLDRVAYAEGVLPAEQ